MLTIRQTFEFALGIGHIDVNQIKIGVFGGYLLLLRKFGAIKKI